MSDASHCTYGSLGVVQPRDDGGVEDGDARADGLRRVVKQSLQVRHAREPEAGNALHSTVDDQVRAVRQSRLKASTSAPALVTLRSGLTMHGITRFDGCNTSLAYVRRR